MFSHAIALCFEADSSFETLVCGDLSDLSQAVIRILVTSKAFQILRDDILSSPDAVFDILVLTGRQRSLYVQEDIT